MKLETIILKGHEFMSLPRKYHIGEIYLMEFEGKGNEQKGWRPGIVFQNNAGNEFSPNILAIPLTSSIKKTGQPTHVVMPASIGLRRDSMALCENPERMSKGRIGEYITTIPDEYMKKIAIAHLLSTSAIAFIEPENLLAVWQRAVALNHCAA